MKRLYEISVLREKILSRTLTEKSVKLGVEIILIKKFSLNLLEVRTKQWNCINSWNL